MITLFFAPQSRSIRILWMLEEMKVPYELEIVNLKKSEQKSAKMMSLNPMGKVPTVVVDGKAVWESPAIVAHLSDLYPETKIAPAVGTPARADFYRWLSFSTAIMEPAFMDHMMKQTPNPTAAGWGSFDSMKKALATAINPGPWILGEQFSGADIMIGGNLSWFCSWQKEAFSDISNVEAYVNRIRERPAFKKAAEIEASILKKIT